MFIDSNLYDQYLSIPGLSRRLPNQIGTALICLKPKPVNPYINAQMPTNDIYLRANQVNAYWIKYNL